MRITKITASRKDDILRRKAQYDADKAAYDESMMRSRKQIRDAERKVLDPIQKFLESQLKRFDALQFDIRVDRGYTWGRSDKDIEYAQVRIQCNDIRKFDDDVALAWSFDVKLDGEGNVVRESSSWSGLKATTIEQMKSLRQTVDALDFLNEVNWSTLIKVDMPKYEDYFDPNLKQPEYQDWDAELADAEIEDIIGQNKLIKVYNWDNSPLRGRYVYAKFIKQSPSQYTVKVIDTWTVENALEGNPDRLQRYLNESWTDRKVRKATIQVAQPIDIVDIDEIMNKG